jgi:hypothetical protein
MPLTLAADHRVNDGVEVVTYLKYIESIDRETRGLDGYPGGARDVNPARFTRIVGL